MFGQQNELEDAIKQQYQHQDLGYVFQLVNVYFRFLCVLQIGAKKKMWLFVSVSSRDDPTVIPRIITSTERWVCGYYHEKKQQFSQKRSMQFPKSYNHTHGFKCKLVPTTRLWLSVTASSHDVWEHLTQITWNYVQWHMFFGHNKKKNHCSPLALHTRFGFFLFPKMKSELLFWYRLRDSVLIVDGSWHAYMIILPGSTMHHCAGDHFSWMVFDFYKHSLVTFWSTFLCFQFCILSNMKQVFV